MPTIPTHAMTAVAIGTAFSRKAVPARWWGVAAVCAMAPDADVAGFALGVHYEDFLGHRGFTHSLCFAALLALALVVFDRNARVKTDRRVLWLYLFVCTASHGLLDALTDGGLGVALLAHFDNSRYFFPVRPLAVSPIGIAEFRSGEAWPVIASELRWIWLPSAILVGIAGLVRRGMGPATERVERE